MPWDEDFDVVCVGSGLGGLTAALTAAERGASAIVLEKFHLLGGVSALSSGQLWLGPNHLAEDAGTVGDEDAAADAYLGHLSQGFATADRRRVFIERGREALRYLTDVIGIEMTVVRGLPDYYHPAVAGSRPEGRYVEVKPFRAERLGDLADTVLTSPYGDGYSFTTSNEWVEMQAGGEHVGSCLARHVAADERCAGAGLAAAQVLAARERGVALRTSAEVIELVIENGTVAGVVVRQAGEARRIRAKLGVVLATGGYDWKADYVRAFDALAEAGSMAPPSVSGDHIVMAAKAGAIAVPARAPAQTPIFVGYKVPAETVYGHTAYRMWLPGTPHCITVNRAGERFCNDSFYPDVATKVGRFDGQEQGYPNWPAWIVFDQDMVDRYGLLPSWPGQPLSEGLALSADSIDALAALAGIDADGLARTVLRFNGFCDEGVDPDFARGTNPWGRIMTGDPRLPNPNMAPIARAPFYAVKLERVTMGVPTAGLPIDTDARVLDAADRPIPGLYAAGNSAAWLDIGGGYNSGIANTRGLLYGYLAVLNMTGQHGAPAA